MTTPLRPLLAAARLAAPFALRAQSVAPAKPQPDETVTLSVFEVRSAKDSGYRVQNSADGTNWINVGLGWEERAARMRGRPWFAAPAKLGAGMHVDVEYLEDRPSTVATRRWMREVLSQKSGSEKTAPAGAEPQAVIQRVDGASFRYGPAMRPTIPGETVPSAIEGFQKRRNRVCGSPLPSWTAPRSLNLTRLPHD